MRLRIFAFLSFLFSIIVFSALADGLSFTYVPETIYPGKAERISLSLPNESVLTLEIWDEGGNKVHTLRDHVTASAGFFTVTFNGMIGQETLAEGIYTLRAVTGSETAEAVFRIGSSAPQIIAVQVKSVNAGETVSLNVDITASTDGRLNALLISPSGDAQPVLAEKVIPAGNSQMQISGLHLLDSGDYSLSLTLTDDSGISSNSYQVSVFLVAPTPKPTPKAQPTVRPAADAAETIAGDYWTMELGNYDWDAIWQVMISPMTIITGTGKQAERQTYKLRAAPASNAETVGLVTCQTQGVHILETLDSGWTLIEVYNSSYGEAYDSAGKGAGFGKTGALVRGYVETSRLDIFTPRTEYGILIDKMTQTLYIITEKGLLSTLLVSTGFATSSQPWNETPAGEFYLSSKVGDFPSGNLVCQYGMRFNNGDILHQVPYIYNEKYDLKDFSACEKYLGEKASHGCIRVQRKSNEDGISMKWIWDNVPTKTKLLIWEDSGRPEPFMEYPVSPDTVLYYNPNGGHYYHADQNCSSIKNRFLPLEGSMTYAELDSSEYDALTPCSHCNPPELRMREIDRINADNGY